LAAAEPDKFNGEGSQFDMKDVTGDAKQAGDVKQQSTGQEEPEQFNGEGSGGTVARLPMPQQVPSVS
jgi:hypothetical protein